MIPFEEYQRSVVAAMRVLPARSLPTSPVDALLGLVSAEPVRCAVPLPGFTNSAMDGYAVRAADVATASEQQPVSLPVAGDIPAGDTRKQRLAAGTSARIMTGAPVPEGADAVVPVERTDAGLTQVAISEAVAPGAAIRRQGEDLSPGDEVLPAGTFLRPRHVPALVSAQLGELAVVPRPRIAVVSTGDELAEPGSAVGHGRVVDSNGPMLAALVREGGFELADVRRVGDTGEQARDTLHELAARADVIVTTGGVSAGAFEPLKLAFGDDQDFRFVKIAMQPGKPQGFGRLGDTVVFALPGNPVSALVSFLTLVAPAARVLAGRDPSIETVPVEVAEAWSSPPGRQQFARVVFDDDGRLVRPIGGQGSHLLGGLAGAEALAIVPAETTQVAPGESLHVIPLDGLA